MRDAAVEVAGPRPWGGRAVTQRQGRRGAVAHRVTADSYEVLEPVAELRPLTELL